MTKKAIAQKKDLTHERKLRHGLMKWRRNEYVVPNDITLSQWIIKWLKTYKTEIRAKTKLQYL